MRRLTSFAIAFAAAMTLGASAKAATLYFEAVSTTATAICTAPCFQVRAFIEDANRAQTYQAIQFDVDIQGATVANLPVPPATNGNAAGPNTTVEDADGATVTIPWELSATVGASPASGFDALFVLASATPFTIDGLAAIRANGVGCSAGAICTIQLNGLTANRIYLGRFNVTAAADGNSIRVANITGVGLPADLAALSGGTCTFAGGNCTVQPPGGAPPPPPPPTPTPEPTGLLLVGLALASLSLVRHRN